eukprot:403338841
MSVSPKQAFKGLSRLLQDDESFNRAFDMSIKEQNTNQNSAPVRGIEYIKQMIDESKFFYIDDKRFVFEGSEHIFYIDRPVEKRQYIEGSGCTCCEGKIKNHKLAQFCDFCGDVFCKHCIAKTRPYPSNMNERGQICRICDRKFYVKIMVQQSRDQIEVNGNLIQNLQYQLTEKDLECKQLDDEFSQFSQLVDLEKERVKKERKLVNKEKKTRVNEVNSFTDECKQLTEKQEEISKQKQEVDETIETLDDEISKLQEQILRVQLQMNQLQNEKKRMNQELETYRKHGNQPRSKYQQQQKTSSNNKSVLLSDSQTLTNYNNLGSTIVGTNSLIDPDYQAGLKTMTTNNFSTMNSPDLGNKILNNSGLMSNRGSITKKKNRMSKENPGYCGPGGGCIII